MNLDDLKDRFKSEWQQTKERLEENPAFTNLRDRYQNLNPAAQKGVLIGGLAVLALVFLSVPWTPFTASSENLATFDEKRSLMRDLLRVQKEINETPEIPLPPPPESIKSRVQSDLQTAQLLPEQIKSVTVLPAVHSKTISESQNSGLVEISLGQLNIKQIVDLGYQFQSISPSVKMKDLIMQASRENPKYFDVIYRLLVLKVAQEEVEPEAPVPGKGKGRGR